VVTEFPGLLNFYVTDDATSTSGIVIGWDAGYLVMLTDELRLVRVEPYSAKVVGKAEILCDDSSGTAETMLIKIGREVPSA